MAERHDAVAEIDVAERLREVPERSVDVEVETCFPLADSDEIEFRKTFRNEAMLTG